MALSVQDEAIELSPRVEVNNREQQDQELLVVIYDDSSRDGLSPTATTSLEDPEEQRSLSPPVAATTALGSTSWSSPEEEDFSNNLRQQQHEDGQRRSHVFFGCCCDLQTACLIINSWFLGWIAVFYGLSEWYGLPFSDRPPLQVWLEIVFGVLGNTGALRFWSVPVFIVGIWYIVQFGFNLYFVFNPIEDVRVSYFAMVEDVAAAYAHLGLFHALWTKRITPENFMVTERHCCDWCQSS